MSEARDDVQLQGGDAGGGPDPNAWMSTFSDLLMLMLTFFVLLLSMSSLDQKEVRSLVRDGLLEESVEGSDGLSGPPEVFNVASLNNTLLELERILNAPVLAEDVERIEQLFKRLHRGSGLDGPLWVEVRPDGLLVNIEASVVFEENSSKLTAEARVFLTQFAGVVDETSHNLVVAAFVAPREGEAREGSWELALRRGDRVVNFLIGARVARERLRLAGYGLAGGAQEERFMRQSQLLRFKLITGPSDAEVGVGGSAR